MSYSKTRLFRRIVSACALLIAVFVSGKAGATDYYTAEKLPNTFIPMQMNASGDIVGWRNLPDGTSMAVIYRQGQLIDLGTLGASGGSRAAVANDAGDVVGVLLYKESPVAHVFRYRNGVMADLGAPVSSTSVSITAINGSGQFTGYALGADDWRPFRHLGGGFEVLAIAGAGRSINSAGAVVGERRLNSRYYLFTWSGNTLTTQADVGAAQSGAADMNDIGQVVGTANQQAYLYSAGGMQILPFLPSGHYAGALGINNGGLIVGENSRWDTQGASRAGLWGQGTAFDLNHLLLSPIDHELFTAVQVLDDGRILSRGKRETDYDYAYYVLTPAQQMVLYMDFWPVRLPGGQPISGRMMLESPAPAGGAVVQLSSDNPAVTVPPTVTIPEGAVSQDFGLTTDGVGSVTTVNVSAEYGGVTRTIQVTLQPSIMTSLLLSSKTVAGSQSLTGTVSVDGKAPTGGITVSLSSNVSQATVPATVTIPAGASSASFPVQTVRTPVQKTATISAKYQTTLLKATFTIRADTVAKLVITPTSVTGGATATGTVTLELPAPPGGHTVTLTATAPSIAEPTTPSLFIPEGATTGTFTVQTHYLTTQNGAAIRATLNNLYKQATVRVVPIAPSALSLSPAKVKGGVSSTGTVALPVAAPPGGFVVSLTSSNASVAAPAESTVTVPAGATSATFPVNTSSVGVLTYANITATGGGKSKTAKLTVTP